MIIFWFGGIPCARSDVRVHRQWLLRQHNNAVSRCWKALTRSRSRGSERRREGGKRMPTTTKTRMTGYEARHKLRRASYRSAHVRTKVRAYVMRKPTRLRRVRLYDDFHMRVQEEREKERGEERRGEWRDGQGNDGAEIDRRSTSELPSSSEMYMLILMPIRFIADRGSGMRCAFT